MDDPLNNLEQLYRETGPALLAYFRRQSALAAVAEDLTRNSDAARQADALTMTLQLARQAVAMPCEAPPRPLALDRLRRARQTGRWRGLTREALGLAACAVLGLALGWCGHTPRRAPVLAQTSVPEPTAAQVVPVELSSGGTSAAPRFWSVAKLQAEQRVRPAAASHQENRYQLQWDSPVKMPRIVKEKP